MFREGLRFRKHYRVPGLARRSIDVALTKAKVAVFIDGCFWHGCPLHGTRPCRNGDFWRRKIEANRLRDGDTDSVLKAAGWRVVRIWEHDDLSAGLKKVRKALGKRLLNMNASIDDGRSSTA